MVKHKQILAILLAASMSIAANAVFAQGMQQGSQEPEGMMMGGGQGGMDPGMMSEMMGDGMMPCPMMGGSDMGMMQQVLVPEQREKMRELVQENRPSQFERLGRVMNLRDDLLAEMHAERPNPDEVKALHDRLAELRGEMLAEHVRHHNAMKDLLNDEQRQQLKRGQT